MKKFTIAVLIIAIIGVTGAPSSVHAATRAELLLQIEQLTALISLLQKQLGLKKQQTTNGDVMQLYLKNISNPTANVFKNGVISASNGDRIGVGWKNSALKSCKLKNLDEDLEEKFYGSRSSEIETGVAVHVPYDVPSQVYEITVECQLDGKTVSDKVKINYSDPFYERNKEINKIDWSKQLQGILREKPAVKGTLNVQQINTTAMKLSGSITPHDNCVGTEDMEVVLDYGNGSSKTFTLEKCEPVSFKETIIYTPSQIPVFPLLKLRWVDSNNNVWQNSELARYKLDLSNPIKPSIINLGVNGEKG